MNTTYTQLYTHPQIGHDTFGEEMMKNFQQQNVCTDYLFITKDAFTSTASITVTRKGLC